MKFNFIISEEKNIIAAFDIIAGNVEDIYNDDYKKEVSAFFSIEKINSYNRILKKLGYTFGSGKTWPLSFSLNEFINFSEFENYFSSINILLEKQKEKL